MKNALGRGTYSEVDPDEKKDWTLLARFSPFVKKNVSLVSVSILLMILLSITEIVVPVVTRTAVDDYILPGMALTEKIQAIPEQGPSSSQATVTLPDNQSLPDEHSGREKSENPWKVRERYLFNAVMAGILLIVLAFVRFILNFCQIIVMEYAGQRMMHDLRMHIFSHIQNLPLVYFSKNTVGRISTRVTNDVQNMQEFFTSIITFVMKDIFMLIGILVILVVMDIRMAGCLFVILPFVWLTTWGFSKLSREVYRFLRANVAEINAMFSESVNGIKVIQLFTRQRQMMADFKILNHDNYLAGMRQIRIMGLFMPMVDLFSTMAVAVIIFYGGGRVVTENFSLGTLVAFISYTKMLFRPIRDLSEKHNILQNALSSAERIVQILDTEEDRLGGTKALHQIETLEFKQVSFQYEKGEENQVIRDVSFQIHQGKSLAILGPTGSGKTSLMNLIVRFYSHDNGRILINGEGIEGYRTRAIRSRVAIVTQDPYLFSGTVRENIQPPGGPLSEEHLKEILVMSYADAVVTQLPQGLDTPISQGGASLSSGERQLISIARAFAHEPDLIIFDEATSYVDTESEEKIRIATSKLKQNRTSITIAHRLRSAVTADQIIILKDGIISEQGTHETLMEKKGFYYGLHHTEAR